MSKETIDMLGDFISIAIGLWFSMDYRRLAKRTSDFYLNRMNMRFSLRGYELGYSLVGIFFLGPGLYSLIVSLLRGGMIWK